MGFLWKGLGFRGEGLGRHNGGERAFAYPNYDHETRPLGQSAFGPLVKGADCAIH